MGIQKKPLALAAAKLASSGLDLKRDAKLLGLIPLSPTQLTAKLAKAPKVPALFITYHDLNGKPRKDMFRVRLLDQPVGGFGEVSKLRYLQPPNSPPAAYLPKSVAWSTVAKDPGVDIMITEGELKAACAAKHGYACIGLGGVSSFQSAKLGWALLPELEEIIWSQRQVYICFDSDAKTNPNIQAAIAKLVRTLGQRGAKCAVVDLPALPELSKTGLDDFVVSRGLVRFKEVVEAATIDDLSRALWSFNDQFCFIMSPGIVYEEAKDLKYDPGKFCSAVYANVWANQALIKPDGGVSQKLVKVADEWVTWEQRRQFSKFTYAPGRDRYLPGGELNCWRGWGVEPKVGDIKLWTKLLDHLLHSTSKEARVWFERWCLYPLKHPGTKLHTSVGIWSKQQGLGKSLIGVTLGRIYGSNYQEISQEDLEDKHNDWLLHKQFIMVDDVSAYDSRAKADKLKKLITQETARVNIKYIPAYTIPDCANYYLTSNRPNAFYVEPDDRRWFIHEVTSPKLSAEFFNAYWNWIGTLEKPGDGAAAILHYAQHELDFGNFEPYLPAIGTAAKNDMVETARSELDTWLAAVVQDPEAMLRKGSVAVTRDIFTASELLDMFEGHRKGPVITVNAMGLRLRDHLVRACGGSTVKVDGKSERLFIARNVDRWREASVKAVADHVSKGRLADGGNHGKRY